MAQFSQVEVPGAVPRKMRTGELDGPDTALLVRAFEADWFSAPGEPARFTVVAATDAVLNRTADLNGVHGLRPCDAVQLASALALAAADPPSSTFVAFDRSLERAAAAEGLVTPIAP